MALLASPETLIVPMALRYEHGRTEKPDALLNIGAAFSRGEDVEALRAEMESRVTALLAQTGEPPEEIRKRVTSPGGTTLAGLTTMDTRGVPEGIAAAVVAASNRAAELSRGG